MQAKSDTQGREGEDYINKNKNNKKKDPHV